MEVTTVKKFFLTGCILCALIFLFAACGDGETTPVGNDTIVTGYNDIGTDWEVTPADNDTIITGYDDIGIDWSELAYSPPLRINWALECNIRMIVTLVDADELELTVNISNQSERVIITGESFVIDFFDGNDWRTAPWQGGFPALSPALTIRILQDESIDITKNLNLFEPLKPGLYRIRKSVSIHEPPFEGRRHDITAEFYWGTTPADNGTIITGCNNFDTDWSELAYSPPLQISRTVECNISMVVTLVDADELELTVNISNQSEYVIVAGQGFVIDFFDGNDWRTAPWQAGMPPPSISAWSRIHQDDSIDTTRSLNLHEPLKPGLYRIRKPVYIDGSSFRDIHDITAEFYWGNTPTGDDIGTDWDELAYSPPLRTNPALECDISMVVTFVYADELELTVNISNQSEHVIITGEGFVIDFFDGNDWRIAPWQGVFPPLLMLEGLWIPQDESIDLTKSLNIFEPLKPGLYRIRKNVFIYGVRNAHDITAEFYWN